ncbi:actin-like protein Arp4p [Punctularia strigosozonata HHB-11173 SS5]|uniref:actin-like protein Arp4p n=1 Tax=Punctularia strigosozonata (strain HHB-11173) TaxID=741275 RepID=UPI000441682F|nr:actin-like protein Arp4p [Punctularia strigosozonata HHB-11173 SS5]EIN10671.1 actin-like protein Arp4p [Punctularia strigosozonata HHB-11173 SS5]
MVQYGGDEVSAVVLDIGSSSLRAGYAGDDAPKAIIPTSYGYLPTTTDHDVEMSNGDGAASAPDPTFSKIFVGQLGPSVWRPGMEVGNPLVDGLIKDFNPIPHLISHAFKDVMRCDIAEHPVLVTEPAWNTQENRERMAEIIFEEFSAPAFYIANTGVLNAFAAGKGSALVVDVGKSQASVTPVVDGFVLRKGMQHSALPQLVHAHAKHILISDIPNGRPPIQLFPHQLILNKQPVEPGNAPRFTLREDRVAQTTSSWKAWYEAREVEEWIQSVAGCMDQGWNDHAAAARPPRQYEFPTGFSTYFGAERFTVGEMFFRHSPQLAAQNPNLPKTIPALVSSSLANCDPDMRQILLANVVVTGGGSLFAGFNERLTNELTTHFANVKIHAPGNPIERRYGGWLGGSILASLGTFHQLWISKEEWQEHGRPIVGQRCK